MIEITNNDIFGKVIADALAATEKSSSLTSANRLRWVNAIGRAAKEIEENPYLDFDREHKSLLICSPSNNIYSANGVCQCKAFENNFPCWHRAAARLVRRYFEAAEAMETIEILETEILETARPAVSAKFDSSSMPYLKNGTGAKPEKVGRYRI